MLLGMRVSILAALKVPGSGWVYCADSRVGNVRRSSRREAGVCPGVPRGSRALGWAAEGHDPRALPSGDPPTCPQVLPSPTSPAHSPRAPAATGSLCTHSLSRRPRRTHRFSTSAEVMGYWRLWTRHFGLRRLSSSNSWSWVR